MILGMNNFSPQIQAEALQFCVDSKEEIGRLWSLCGLYQDLKYQILAWREDTRIGLERLFRPEIAVEFVAILDDPGDAKSKVSLDSYVAHADSYLSAVSVRAQRNPAHVLKGVDCHPMADKKVTVYSGSEVGKVLSKLPGDAPLTHAFDIFVCHASEDKDSFVRPLAAELQA